jgi:hypothetical protein
LYAATQDGWAERVEKLRPKAGKGHPVDLFTREIIFSKGFDLQQLF